MVKKNTFIKHAEEKQAHIPSQEEVGYEVASAKVKAGKKKLELPKNPVCFRGQDPELFWMNKYSNIDKDTRSTFLKESIRKLELSRIVHTVKQKI